MKLKLEHGCAFIKIYLCISLIIRMVAHAIELLTAGSDHAEMLLHEEQQNLGGISIEELHRLVYAQILSSHPLTWQVSANNQTMITNFGIWSHNYACFIIVWCGIAYYYYYYYR